MLVRRLGAFFLDIVQVLVFAVSIFLFIYLLVLQPHKIKGNSMDPTFLNGQFLLTDKVSYRFGQPERGDIVVFKAPPDEENEFIKRIIGIPGDSVMIQEGRVYVNGNVLQESYLDPSLDTKSGNIAIEGVPLTIPQGRYFVMGDNRNHSFDSRNFGAIEKSKIVGRAWLLYWPPSEAGFVKKTVYAK